MRTLGVVLFVFLLIFSFGCEQQETDSAKRLSMHSLDTSQKEGRLEFDSATLSEWCVECSQLYKLVPTDAVDFKNKYSYVYGVSYNDGFDDLNNYFSCLSACFDFQRLLDVLRLSCEVEYDADAPAQLDFFLSDYLMTHLAAAQQAYDALSCDEFEKHVRFLFSTVEGQLPVSHPSYSKLCSFLKAVDVESKCKKSLISSYCDLLDN